VEDRNCREARILRQHTQTVACILEEGSDEVHAAGVAALLFHLIETAEFETRATGGFLPRQA
jgi:hypothetical protein